MGDLSRAVDVSSLRLPGFLVRKRRQEGRRGAQFLRETTMRPPAKELGRSPPRPPVPQLDDDVVFSTLPLHWSLSSTNYIQDLLLMDLLLLFVWTILAIRNVSISLLPAMGSSISLFLLSGTHPLSCVLFGRRRLVRKFLSATGADRGYCILSNAMLFLPSLRS